MLTDLNEREWLAISVAVLYLRQHFKTEAALRYHVRRRATNGLLAADAVRESPLGRILVNPARLNRWAMGEQAKAA